MNETKVIDSRLVTEGVQVRRRRQCVHCRSRFTTYETLELVLPRVIKRDKTRCIFDKGKLKVGIMKALEKRPVSTEALNHILARIMRKLWNLGQSEVASEQIGQWVMDELSSLDPVAYIRFASVYHSFKDVQAFIQTIKKMKNNQLWEHERDAN